MDEDCLEGSRFSGYDWPSSTHGRNNKGNKGDDRSTIPPTGGNVAGGGDLGDSDYSADTDNSHSPPFDPRKIVGTRRDHGDDARKTKYDERLPPLLKLYKRQRKDKGSAYKPKKPERLQEDSFDSKPKDTQRLIQDVAIKLNCFREFLVDNMEKISFVIPLLRARAKRLYHSIHVCINEDTAIDDKRPFDLNNLLRPWEDFHKHLLSCFVGYSDRDRPL